MSEPTVAGVDFSGAARPAESIWLTTAAPTDAGLAVEAVRSAAGAFGDRERSAVLSALVEWALDPGGPDVVGLDFPFGLPRPVLADLDAPESWTDTVRWVGAFADADRFRDACTDAADRVSDGERTYLRRRTDDPLGAKSPYHFFTFRQCYHGCRGVLEPLLDAGAAVEPMAPGDTGVDGRNGRDGASGGNGANGGDGASGGDDVNGGGRGGHDGAGAGEATPTVVEVYPAATLSRLGLPRENYKDDTADARRTRERVVEYLTGESADDPDEVVRLPGDDARADLVGDADGDALDSLVAAVAAARASDREFDVEEDRYDPREGYIYV